MGTETQTQPIRSRSSITKLVPQIKRHLRETWLQKSKSDPCLFLRKDMIIVLYTDDCLLCARDTTNIDKFIKTLRDDYKLTLNDPDSIDDFLGIHFSHQDNGELHMIQTGLIDAVTESAHIPKGRLKNTPTPATAILYADTEGLARQ
jgi:hypothetical protein